MGQIPLRTTSLIYLCRIVANHVRHSNQHRRVGKQNESTETYHRQTFSLSSHRRLKTIYQTFKIPNCSAFVAANLTNDDPDELNNVTG